MKNILAFLIFLLYVLLLAVLWMNSKHPSVKDIPAIYIVGIIVALFHVLLRNNRQYSMAIAVVNIVLFLASAVYLVGVYGFLKTIFKG